MGWINLLSDPSFEDAPLGDAATDGSIPSGGLDYLWTPSGSPWTFDGGRADIRPLSNAGTSSGSSESGGLHCAWVEDLGIIRQTFDVPLFVEVRVALKIQAVTATDGSTSGYVEVEMHKNFGTGATVLMVWTPESADPDAWLSFETTATTTPSTLPPGSYTLNVVGAGGPFDPSGYDGRRIRIDEVFVGYFVPDRRPVRQIHVARGV